MLLRRVARAPTDGLLARAGLAGLRTASSPSAGAAPRRPPADAVAAAGLLPVRSARFGGPLRAAAARDASGAVAAEAAGGTVAALIAVAGLGAGIAVVALRGSGKTTPGPPIDAVNPADFALLARTPTSLVFAYRGDDPSWRGTTLHFRADSQDAVEADAKATQALGGRFAPASTVVHLDSAVAGALAKNSGLADAGLGGGGRGAVCALRVDGVAGPPPELCEGPVLTVELRPGVGLLDLYGNPGLYRVEDESVLRKSELAKAGRFNPQDLYSPRPDIVQRALGALAEDPEQAGLAVFLDGARAFPAPATPAADLPAAAGSGWPLGMQELLSVLAGELVGEGKELMTALLRAQCGAAGAVPSLARDVRSALLQRTGAEDLPTAALRREAFEAAFARGFWSITADSSGMHWREREAERLLERARRELWIEGSASRRELEAEIHKFLIRYRVGRAASQACLRLRLAKPAAGPAGAEEFRRLNFAPLAGGQGGLWARLDLDLLEVPLK